MELAQDNKRFGHPRLFTLLKRDKNIHVAIFLPSGAIESFKIRAIPKLLSDRLLKYQSSKSKVKACYESSYLGFSLARKLINSGIHCDVVAAGLIPNLPSKRVKTDRLDAQKLARFYQQGLLTAIYLPSENDESERDLIRSRNFLRDQIRAQKQHIQFLLKRAGFNFKQETGLSQSWTPKFRSWLKDKFTSLPVGALKLNLEMLVSNLDVNEEYLARYDEQIIELSKSKKYDTKVRTLKAFKGVKELTAMTFITELGDVRRFSHPKKLTSYLGLDVMEYSSGGKERRYGITKMGNKFIRTLLIESVQFAYRDQAPSRYLRERRKNAPIEAVEIAEKCQIRLKKKAYRMLMQNKPRNVVKVACARELSCFMWESLKLVS